MVSFKSHRLIEYIFLALLVVLIVSLPVTSYSQQDVPKVTDLVDGSKEKEAVEQDEEVKAETEAADAEKIKPKKDTPPAPKDEFNRGTPRSTFVSFLKTARSGDFENAKQYLYLRDLPPAMINQGERLSRQLRIVIDRSVWINSESISDHPEGNLEDGFSGNLERIGRIDSETEAFDIMLQRIHREDGVYIWKFSSETVSDIPQMYKQFGYGFVGEFLSPFFPSKQFMGVRMWQWFAIFVFGALAYLVAWLLTKLAMILFQFKQTEMNKQFQLLCRRPARFFLFIFLWRVSTSFVDLSVSVRAVLYCKILPCSLEG